MQENCYVRRIFQNINFSGIELINQNCYTNLTSIDPVQQKIKIKPIDVMSLKRIYLDWDKVIWSHHNTRCLYSRHFVLLTDLILFPPCLEDCTSNFCQILSFQQVQIILFKTTLLEIMLFHNITNTITNRYLQSS